MKDAEITYPKICRTSVKVQLQVLSRRANAHFSEVLRVILHIIRRDISRLIITSLLLQLVDHMSFPANGYVSVRPAHLMDTACKEVGSFPGRVEAPFAEGMDVGFGAGAAVIGVGDELDSVDHGVET